MKSNLVNIIPLSSEGMENLSKLNTSASNFITNYYLTGLFQDVFSQLVGANPEHNYKTQAFILKLGEKKVTTAKLAEKLYNCLNLKHDTEYKNLVNSTSINADNDEVHAQTGIFNFLSNLFSFQNTNTLINSDPKDNIIDALFLFGNIKDKLKLLCKTDKADLQELNPNYCPSVQTGEIMLKLYTIFRDMPEYIEPGTMNKYDLIMELITKLSTVLYDWATSLNVETPEICNDVFNIDPKISFLIKNAAEEVAILLLEKKAAEIQECNAELLISIAGNDSEDMLDYPFADHDCSIIFENTNIEVEGSIFLPEEL